MQAFLIELIDEVGDFARVAAVIADKGINITGFSGASRGAGGTAVVTVADGDLPAMRSALQGIPVGYREYELVEVPLANVVGSLATATGKLADAGVGIEAALPTGMDNQNVTVAFAVSDPATAKNLLL